MKLLVAYLATPGGQDALALGTCLARSLGAAVDVVLVIPPDRSAEFPETKRFADELDEQAHRWLAEAAAGIPEDVTARTQLVINDNPAEGVIAAAEALGADIIVSGGSGGGLLGRHTLGTVVNGLLHSSPLPVVLAPSGFREVGASRVGRVSAAVGLRPGAQAVMQVAAAISGDGGLPIRLLSLVVLDDMDQHRGLTSAQALRHATEHITKCAADLSSAMPGVAEVTTEVVDGGGIEEAVTKVGWGADDLLVVGSSRLAAPGRTFLGTTAAKMLRVLAAPVVVVPRHQAHG